MGKRLSMKKLELSAGNVWRWRLSSIMNRTSKPHQIAPGRRNKGPYMITDDVYFSLSWKEVSGSELSNFISEKTIVASEQIIPDGFLLYLLDHDGTFYLLEVTPGIDLGSINLYFAELPQEERSNNGEFPSGNVSG